MRLGAICDYAEEDWPSMDLCADKLLAHWPASSALATTRIRPPLRRRFQSLPFLGARGAARNADRLLGRFFDYPRHLHHARDRFDLFHLVDHSYSQLLLSLPAGRAGIFCHDLDTFRCLLHPEREPRPVWFRAMVRRILRGFRSAAVVFHATGDVRRQLLETGWVRPDQLVSAPLGVSPVFRPAPAEFTPAPLSPTHPLGSGDFLLHVGSCIPRKRIDVLLRTVAGVRKKQLAVRLVQIGGQPTADQLELARSLNLDTAVTWLGRQPIEIVAEGYRRARVVLQPSEAEGFGLPVAEALACGAPVLASDLPTLREVGADAARFAPVADIEAWCAAVLDWLSYPTAGPSPDQRLARAAVFSWDRHAAIIESTYRERLAAKPAARGPSPG